MLYPQIHNLFQFKHIFFIFLFGVFCLQIAYSQPFLAPTPHDTAQIALHKFDSNALQAYKQSEDFQYNNMNSSRNWFERLLKWLNQYLGSTSSTKRNIVWEILGYAIAIAAVVLILLQLFQVKLAHFWYKKALTTDDSIPQTQAALEHIDFDQLIQDEVQKGNYTIAVRLLYLETLKLLSQASLIEWRPEKTNLAYHKELAHTPFGRDFYQLASSYEHVWYGNFSLDLATYHKIAAIFRHFKQKF